MLVSSTSFKENPVNRTLGDDDDDDDDKSSPCLFDPNCVVDDKLVGVPIRKKDAADDEDALRIAPADVVCRRTK
jgi:hypothetical protein